MVSDSFGQSFRLLNRQEFGKVKPRNGIYFIDFVFKLERTRWAGAPKAGRVLSQCHQPIWPFWGPGPGWVYEPGNALGTRPGSALTTSARQLGTAPLCKSSRAREQASRCCSSNLMAGMRLQASIPRFRGPCTTVHLKLWMFWRLHTAVKTHLQKRPSKKRGPGETFLYSVF